MAKLLVAVIPKIELNESRRIEWDRICDELDVDDNADLKIQEIKDLKEWYANPRGEHTKNLCIAGINLIIVCYAEYYESEDYDKICEIENFQQLYDWLGEEAKEEVRLATVLDLTKAERFLEDEGSVNLSEMTSITEEAAEMLSTYGGEIDLSGLTDLPEKAAEALSKHQGMLDFEGLTELSDCAAEALSKLQACLVLSDLIGLSDAAAESLSRHQGELGLNDSIRISNAAANSLSKHQGEINGMDPSEWVASLENKNKN